MTADALSETEAMSLLGIPEEELQDPSEVDQPTFMQRLADATGWKDRELGSIMGVRASAVGNYRTGIRRFRPVKAQRRELRVLMENQILNIKALLTELDELPGK